MNCANCAKEVNAKFCPNCGQAAEVKRIDGHYLLHEVQHVLHLERGILYTVREMLARPGKSIRDYLLVNRNRLVKPILFIIVTSLFYSVVNHYFHIEAEYGNFQPPVKSAVFTVWAWIQGHYGYANIIMGIFIALWTKLFFRKHPFNLYEILVLLCFVMGMGMLVLSFLAIAQELLSINLVMFGSVVVLAYITWAVGQFYGQGKLLNYLKAFLAYILGMISFAIAITLVGIGVDLISKQ
ncbi:MAG: DUF3667 domain-containing protein [Flavobacteriales bacterium]|nr:DUF3667 domain-containing protein [Flavobacteriales bacterium]